MTARIFAYIAHKGGVADDSAAELLAAAKKIDSAASATAVVTGTGAEFDAVCESLRASYGEVWKIASESLALSKCRACPQGFGEGTYRRAASCLLRTITLESIWRQASPSS